jgi:outer membrane lipoprotein-sorting protein
LRRLSLFLVLSTAALPAATVDSVLARMDEAGTAFRGMTAKMRKLSYTAIIKETLEESGKITLRCPKPRQVQALIDFDKPDLKSFLFRDKKVQIFMPKLNTVQEWDLGKFDSLLTQGLLIGFATPSKEIRKNYSVLLVGEETVVGRKTFKLELVPTVESIRQHFTKIDLWIAISDGLPVQQRLIQASGDYTQIIYSDMQLQAVPSDQQVSLKLPPNVKREYPQKK